jgi:hypothetical protein
VNFYARIGRIDEHRFEIFDMFLNAGRLVAIRPVDLDIF